MDYPGIWRFYREIWTVILQIKTRQKARTTMSEIKISDALKKAREYEKEYGERIPAEQRPVFHLCPPVGWMNDPNGFSLYQGEYHLFFQYHPYGTNWGPMHWGHSKTKDFIHWEALPAALAPDTEYDGQGCFSGSAFEQDGQHVLMYTGVLEQKQEDGSLLSRQTQCIAIGDGINYQKLLENPVITADSLPGGSSREDFRDPKAWREGERIYAIVGSRSRDGSGQLPLYTSLDGKNWKYVSVLAACNHEVGKMWECPDFFPLGQKHVLVLSPQEMEAEGLEYHTGNGTVYMTGIYDKQSHSFQKEHMGAIDYGLDFYAPQTTLAADGRRIMIGWMQSWDNYMTPPEFAWSGMMSIPRELSVKNGRLFQYPVAELDGCRRNEKAFQNVEISGMLELPGVTGRCADLEIEVDAGEYQEFWVELAAGGKRKTTVCYQSEKSILTVDRKYSGMRRDVIGERSMYVKHQGGRLKLRIILDYYSVELFVNDGEQAMTTLIYTDREAEAIRFGCKGHTKISVKKYDICL